MEDVWPKVSLAYSFAAG